MCEEIISILPLILIFISQFVLGVGNSLYHSLGKSYLDDNIEKTKTPLVLAGVLCLRMFGPLMGFALGYFMLRIFIDPSKTPLITNKDPRWIGAYWIGWIIVGFAVMFFAILIGMFPREFPNKNKKTNQEIAAAGNGKVAHSNCELDGVVKEQLNQPSIKGNHNQHHIYLPICNISIYLLYRISNGRYTIIEKSLTHLQHVIVNILHSRNTWFFNISE